MFMLTEGLTAWKPTDRSAEPGSVLYCGCAPAAASGACHNL
jgi:hypothetical protein